MGHRGIRPRHPDGRSQAREQAALQLGGHLQRSIALGPHQVTQIEAGSAGVPDVGERHRAIRQLGGGEAEEWKRAARLEPHGGDLGRAAGHDDRARHGADELGGAGVVEVHDHVDAAVGQHAVRRARGRAVRAGLDPEPVDERPQARVRNDLAIRHADRCTVPQQCTGGKLIARSDVPSSSSCGGL